MTTDRNSITLIYSGPPGADAADFVLLEQQEWDKNVNRLTKLGVIGYLNNLLYGGTDITENCSDAARGYHVYAYPSRPDLNYSIGCSQGSLGPSRIEQLVYSEIINCDLKTELTPRYPVMEIKTFGWIGDPLGLEGHVVERPELTLTPANTLLISDPVYGSVLITYSLIRHARTLAINPLPGAVENALQCWIYALWPGGRRTLEYNFPEGDDLINDAGGVGVCQGSRTLYHGTINDSPTVKCVTPEDEEKYSDYCDQKI